MAAHRNRPSRCYSTPESKGQQQDADHRMRAPGLSGAKGGAAASAILFSRGVRAAAAPEISSLRRRSIGSIQQRLQHGASFNASGRWIAGPLRVGHQPKNIAFGVGDTGDVID